MKNHLDDELQTQKSIVESDDFPNFPFGGMLVPKGGCHNKCTEKKAKKKPQVSQTRIALNGFKVPISQNSGFVSFRRDFSSGDLRGVFFFFTKILGPKKIPKHKGFWRSFWGL